MKDSVANVGTLVFCHKKIKIQKPLSKLPRLAFTIVAACSVVGFARDFMRFEAQDVGFCWQCPHPNPLEVDERISVRTVIRAAQAQDNDAMHGIGRYVTQRRS